MTNAISSESGFDRLKGELGRAARRIAELESAMRQCIAIIDEYEPGCAMAISERVFPRRKGDRSR